jgi:hypothetical protein
MFNLNLTAKYLNCSACPVPQGIIRAAEAAGLALPKDVNKKFTRLFIFLSLNIFVFC